MRSRFDEQLAELNSELIEMGALCEEVIALATKALAEGDMELAQTRRSAGRGHRPDGAHDRIHVPEAATCSSSRWRATCGRYPPRLK